MSRSRKSQQWLDPPRTLCDVRLSEGEIAEFRASRVWLQLVQSGLEKRASMFGHARNPTFNERQAAMCLGFTEGIEYMLELVGNLKPTDPARATEKSAIDEETLRNFLKLRGDI